MACDNRNYINTPDLTGRQQLKKTVGGNQPTPRQTRSLRAITLTGGTLLKWDRDQYDDFYVVYRNRESVFDTARSVGMIHAGRGIGAQYFDPGGQDPDGMRIHYWVQSWNDSGPGPLAYASALASNCCEALLLEILEIEQAAFTWTGFPALRTVSRLAAKGDFTLTGQDAVFCHSWIADDVTAENVRAMGNDENHSYVAEILAGGATTRISKVSNLDGSVADTLDIASTFTYVGPYSMLVDSTYIYLVTEDYGATDSVLRIVRILKSDFTTTASVTLDSASWLGAENTVTFQAFQMITNDGKLYVTARRNNPAAPIWKLHRVTSFSSVSTLSFSDAGSNFFDFSHIFADADNIYLPGVYDDGDVVFALVVIDITSYAETDRVTLDAGILVDDATEHMPITGNDDFLFIGFPEDDGEFASGIVTVAKSGYSVVDTASYSDVGGGYVKWMDELAGLIYANGYIYTNGRGGSGDVILGRVDAENLSTWDIQTIDRFHGTIDVHDSLFKNTDDFYSPFAASPGVTGGVVKFCGFTPD